MGNHSPASLTPSHIVRRTRRGKTLREAKKKAARNFQPPVPKPELFSRPRRQGRAAFKSTSAKDFGF